MSREVIIAPDPFKAVVPHLRSVLNGVEAGVTMPAAQSDKFVWVRRVSTASADLIIDRPSLDFVVFGSKPAERTALANLARGHLLAMEGTYDGVHVFSVTEVVGPQDMPDPNVDGRTVTMFTLQINVRATAL